jgi:hypothetical protein
MRDIVERLREAAADHDAAGSYGNQTLFADSADEVEHLRDALRWLVNVLNDVGKAGGRPEPQEFEAAHAHALHTLKGEETDD